MRNMKRSGLEKGLYHLASLAILIGFALTIVSGIKLCTEACAEAHNYRLFGMYFETTGFAFFMALALCHILAWWYPQMAFITGLMLAGGVGAELMFIALQKYVIGTWCPLCLGIAASVGVAALAYVASHFIVLQSYISNNQKGEIMKSMWKGLSTVSIMGVAFVMTFLGVTKVDTVAAAEGSLKESIALGKTTSDVEVYLFTDWACPACRALEPRLIQMAPQIMEKAKLIFVDFPVHPETLNFSPYNLSFMIHNKPKYLELRESLTELSKETGSPEEEQVEEMAQKFGVVYKQLNYSDVALATKYFKKLGKQFEVKGTPSMVLINVKTNEGKKLVGIYEINASNVMNAIDSLSKE